MLVMSNTVLNGNEVELKTYEGTVEGLIKSNVERFDDVEELYQALIDLSKADQQYFC